MAAAAPIRVLLVDDDERDYLVTRGYLTEITEQAHSTRSTGSGQASSGQAWLAARVPELAAMRPADGRAMAYVCDNFTCRQPVGDVAALRALLG